MNRLVDVLRLSVGVLINNTGFPFERMCSACSENVVFVCVSAVVKGRLFACIIALSLSLCDCRVWLACSIRVIEVSRLFKLRLQEPRGLVAG